MGQDIWPIQLGWMPRGEFCKYDTVYSGLQTFGTAVVAIKSVASKSPSF
jgi:hypothetical protein